MFFLFWSCFLFTPYVFYVRNFGRNNEKAKYGLHRMLQWISKRIVRALPATHIKISGIDKDDFNEPKLIVSNHQSHIDLPVIMSLSPKMVFLTNDRMRNNKFFGKIVHEAEFLPVSAGIEEIMPKLQNLKSRGYSIVVFPEGTRSEDDSIQRFHQGAFYLAQELNLDIKPLVLHGAGYYLRKNDALFRKGDIELAGLPVVKRTDLAELPLRKQASRLRQIIRTEYDNIVSLTENSDYFKSLVAYKYDYRGWKVVSVCKKVLSFNDLAKFIDKQEEKKIRIINSGYGVFALLYAYVNKSAEIYAYEEDIDKYKIAIATSNIPKNLHFIHSVFNESYEDLSFDKTISLEGCMKVCSETNLVKVPLVS